MPELPEVETMVRGIRPTVVGKTLTAIRRCRCACKPISISPSLSTISRRMRGHTIVDVRRLAKRVVLELSSDESLVIEPRMTGLVLTADPPDREHLRLRCDLAHDANGASSFWFWDRRGLGTVRLFRPDEFQAALGPKHLGPDALEMTAGSWKRQLARTARDVKVALLDQKLVAGIGNLYASEILHTAGINPRLPAASLSRRQCRRLHCACQEILNAAIQYEGSTLGDGTYRNALNQPGRFQNHHRVYQKAGRKCSRCQRGEITRIVQAQRSTFFCPNCQK